MNKRDVLLQNINQLTKVYMDTCKVEFEEERKALFANYGDYLKEISFTAYTPYFNDGEPCTFHVHNDDFNLNGYNGYGRRKTVAVPEWPDLIIMSMDSEYINEKWVKKEADPIAKSIVEAVRAFLTSFSDDFYQSFGEGRFIINEDGLKVEDYDHD